MRAGNLDRRIDLMTKNAGQTTSGDSLEGETVFGTVYAEKKDLPFEESFDGSQYQGRGKVSFRIYWRGDVDHKTLIRFPTGAGGAIYDIVAVQEIGRREGLMLIAVAGID